MLKSAYYLINDAIIYKPKSTHSEMLEQYVNKDYLIDVAYREFYYHYDAIEDNSDFEEIRQYVENVYTNTFLAKSATAWTKEVEKAYDNIKIVKQKTFITPLLETRQTKKGWLLSFQMRFGLSVQKNLQSLFIKILLPILQ